MAIPDYESLMLPVLKYAATIGHELRISDVVSAISDQLQLSEAERNQLLPSGKQTIISNRIHWAKFYLQKAGLVESPRRGAFKITSRGMGIFNDPPARIDRNYLMAFAEFRQFVDGSESMDNGDAVVTSSLSGGEQTPDEIMRQAHQKIHRTLGLELLDRVRKAPPEFFERLIVDLLLAMGYGGSVTNAGKAIGKSGDDGIDGVIDQDALGLDRVYIQAKRYADGNNIGSGAIRDFFGSLDRHKATKGLFVTTSDFSQSAKETAEMLSKRIVLLNGDSLASLMIKHDVGCRAEETLHIKKLDEDFFESE